MTGNATTKVCRRTWHAWLWSDLSPSLDAMCPNECPRGLSPTVLGVAELSARLAQQERNDAPAGSPSVIMICCWIQTAAWSCQLFDVAAPGRFSKLSIQPSKRSTGRSSDELEPVKALALSSDGSKLSLVMEAAVVVLCFQDSMQPVSV